MEDIKKLVNDIVEYTRTWSITDAEWYWNINSVRKSNIMGEDTITNDEFEVAIREEILYDLVFKNGVNTINQMENDLCNYDSDDISFHRASVELENKIQKVINSFRLERY
jgi:hypothetical protein